MNTGAHVSVVIPTYNRAGYITRAVESVFAQTYHGYEIIVVDDGSSDNTGEMLRERYGDRIKYIYQPNSGPAAARNRGIDAAGHELVAFLDSDDVWMPRKLELQVPLMSDPGVVLSFTNWTTGKDDARADCFSTRGLGFGKDSAVLDSPMRLLTTPDGACVLLPTCICRKDAVTRAGRFDERLRVAEDTRLIFRLAHEGKFGVLAEPLFVRGLSAENGITRRDSRSYLQEHAREALAILLESYSRDSSGPDDVLDSTRKMIAFFLSRQSQLYSLERDNRSARRKALESLAYSRSGRAALKAFIGLLSPDMLSFLSRKDHGQ